jgi:hypothetical protein
MGRRVTLGTIAVVGAQASGQPAGKPYDGVGLNQQQHHGEQDQRQPGQDQQQIP